jgi:hypothetical protein
MRRRVARLLVAAILLAGQLLLFASVATAADITSTGPLTHVIVTPDLSCQVSHVEDALAEFYGSSTLGSCGTFVFVNGTLYAPTDLPSGSFVVSTTPWTGLGQSPVTGTGTQTDPFRIGTRVEATGTGLQLQQVDSYVLGTQQYRTDIEITNSGAVAQTGVLYRAGDCYLQESDVGFGRVDGNGPACVSAQTSSSRIQQWTPITPGSHYMEGQYTDVYAHVNGAQFPDTCACDFAFDNGAGLSWPFSVAPGQSVTFSHETYFSPRGRAPTTESYVQSVPDPTQITLDPIVVAQTVAVTAGVILLVPFPSALFNSTLEENYDEVMAGVGRVSRRLRRWWLSLVTWVRARIAERRQPGPAQPPAGTTAPPTIAPDHPLGGPLPPSVGPQLTPRVTALTEGSVPGSAPLTPPAPAEVASRDIWRTPLGILAFVLISALFYAFLDPTFGFSLQSIATLLGLALGLVVILVAYGVPLILFSRSHSIGLSVRALPATLIVAVVCVLVSRLSDFQPGYLYGLVVGFFFAHTVTRDVEGKAEAAAAGSSLIAALVAWILLAVLRGGGSTDAFTNALLQSATVTIVVAGLENAVFAMLPLRFLPGAAVYAWKRIVWVVLIGLGLFGFAHVLLNPSAGAGYLADTTRTSFFTLVVLLAAFAVVSVGFWAWFRFRPRPSHEGGPAL